MQELINWLWLEDLLVRACEAEIREFAAAHPGECFFAFCLEFDGLDADVRLSYGTRPSVDAAMARLRRNGEADTLQYRAIELNPQFWVHRETPRRNPDGVWERVDAMLERVRAQMSEEVAAEITEFTWMRFEYLIECVVRRLLERGAFASLPRDPEFLAFSANEHEELDELEERLVKLYPDYNRATMEWTYRARAGESPARLCQGAECVTAVPRRSQVRCTYCHAWHCEECAEHHIHPQLRERQPLFMGGRLER